jgi:hypothetical protein
MRRQATVARAGNMMSRCESRIFMGGIFACLVVNGKAEGAG